MTRADIIGLVASYVYAFALLLVVEGTGRALKWPQHITRKIVHVGAGMWVWGILALFDHWYYGVIPFATFIIMNWVFYRFRLFQQMDSEESSPGTVYFALSITVLFLLFWRTENAVDRVPIAAAAVMAMTWGDALAHVIGRAIGTNKYTLFNHTRSWQGTATMVVVSFVAMFLTLWLLPGSTLSPNSVVIGPVSAAIMAFFTALVASMAEGASPLGLDNLTVPLLSAASLFLLYQL